MPVFRCKMCGGTLEINNNETVAECEYCGTKQTLPRLDDERRANLYDRANHFRRSNEFDKAMGIYEQILNEDSTDAEAYWSLVLCRYGVEYVEDPATHRRVPTVNRAQFTSVLADADYKSALKHADGYQRVVYEDEAKAIDEIQKGILAISQKEEPFDVFICYKESDNTGRRTHDSVLANDLYHQLTQEGFKVFFSRITLEDKLGSAYEPYIFAALNSAKVMVVLGTKAEYFNAVWVKNEWSRYLALIRSGANKTLIPAYRDMDPYDLPEEFSHLQAQDMSKLGFMQDLVRGIKKIAEGTQPAAPAGAAPDAAAGGGANTAPLLRRMHTFLEDSEWKSADEYAERVLDIDPENGEAYLGKLMAEVRVRNKEGLKECRAPLATNNNYLKVLRFMGNDAMIRELEEIVTLASERAEIDRKNNLYASAKSKMTGRVVRIDDYQDAIRSFESIYDWKDSAEQIRICQEKINEINARDEQIRSERQKEFERLSKIKARDEKAKRIIITALPFVIFGILAVILIFNLVSNSLKQNAYYAAIELLEERRYMDAHYEFEALEDFEESVKYSKYSRALELMSTGDYVSAYEAFEYLDDFQHSNALAEFCYAVNSGAYYRAYAALATIDDSINETDFMTYMDAHALINEGNYREAYGMLESLGDFFDSDELAVRLFDSHLNPRPKIESAQVGDEITFGTYEQRDIEWLVLEQQDDRILVISKYALGVRRYNDSTSSEEVTWEDSTTCKFLNTSFLETAFGDFESPYIDSSASDAGAVFLLSAEEAETYFPTPESRRCTAQNDFGRAFSAAWWLRSSSEDGSVECVSLSGDILSRSATFYSETYFRPAMWLSVDVNY